MLSDGSYNHGFKGNLIAQEYTDEYGADELNEYLDSASLIDVVDNTEKTYATRIDCEDGSYVDLAACGMPDSSGIVVVYYHTPAEYVDNYNLSLHIYYQVMMTGKMERLLLQREIR